MILAEQMEISGKFYSLIRSQVAMEMSEISWNILIFLPNGFHSQPAKSFADEVFCALATGTREATGISWSSPLKFDHFMQF